MAKEKKVEEKEASVEDLKKSVDGCWALVRRIKDYLEKINGADIDGDGHIGPWKSAVLAFLLMSSVCNAWSPTSTNVINYTDETGTNEIFYIDHDGIIHAGGSDGLGVAASQASLTAGKLTVQTNVDVAGAAYLAGNAVLGNATNDQAILSGNVVVSNNIAIAGTLTYSRATLACGTNPVVTYTAPNGYNTNAWFIQMVGPGGTNVVIPCYPTY